MRYYPAFLDLQSRSCVVVGGGALAWRKARVLQACGARVTIVSPEAVTALKRMAVRRQVVWHRRRFRRGDLRTAFLVVAATDDQRVNQAVFAEASRLQRLMNVVDHPALCSFIVPSIMRRGRLTIAISTEGASPALSRWIRLDLTKRYGPAFARLLQRMAVLRRQIHGQVKDPAVRKQRLEQLLRRELGHIRGSPQ